MNDLTRASRRYVLGLGSRMVRRELRFELSTYASHEFVFRSVVAATPVGSETEYEITADGARVRPGVRVRRGAHVVATFRLVVPLPGQWSACVFGDIDVDDVPAVGLCTCGHEVMVGRDNTEAVVCFSCMRTYPEAKVLRCL